MPVISALERPQLRPHVEPVVDRKDPDHVYLVDHLGVSPGPQRLTVEQYYWLRLFDGERDLRDVQYEAMRQNGGALVPLDSLADLARRLEKAWILDGPAYRSLVNSPVRPPRCIGCYEGEATLLRRQIQRQFTGPGGPGLPRDKKTDGRIHAALIPHIDYRRGGHSYAWAFKEVAEHADAGLFVIIGTSHYSTHRFTLTRKDFETPLGVARTDQGYIDRLVHHYGDGLFDDELLAHLPEHSIELEVVFLQYLYNTRRDFRIVPLVVGPFCDCVDNDRLPQSVDDIAGMINALRAVESELAEPVCYIISGDLAHLGPKFGDPGPVNHASLKDSQRQDQSLLARAEAIDLPGYFQIVALERDARRICGLPPTYTLLEAIQPRRGKVLHYQQYVHPQGQESVSFASAVFYR